MLNRLRRLVLSPEPRNTPTVVKLTEVEQRATILAGKTITYTLKRSSKRRSIALRIDARGLTVSMPLRASEHWLNDVLQNKAGWVVEKLADWQERQVSTPQWLDGELIPYLGEVLILRVGQFPSSVQCEGGELRVFARNVSDVVRIEKSVSRWYRQQAMLLFAERVAHFSSVLDVAPVSVGLTNAKTRWGSCTSRGMIRLNLRLIQLPMYLIDYVVVHELAHLREMNHSAAFWQVVARACPDYMRLRRELKACSL